jgi:hypothetical protein
MGMLLPILLLLLAANQEASAIGVNYGTNGDNLPIFRPNRGVYDPATKLNYTSMLDAQIDAVYTAMKKLGFGRGVQIAIGEAGWPTKAESGQAGVGVQEAKDFNAGLIRVCSGGKGTPLMPGKTFEAYIFALFNKNQKPGPIAERNWGIFNTDFTPKYDLGLHCERGVTPLERDAFVSNFCSLISPMHVLVIQRTSC